MWDLFESLVRFDTSRVKWLKIVDADPSEDDIVHPVVFPTRNLCVLTLHGCGDRCTFLCCLSPQPQSTSAIVCLKLEELAIGPHRRERFTIKDVIKVAASRAARGAELNTVRIVGRYDGLAPAEISELQKHVLHVEDGPRVVERMCWEMEF